MNFLEEPGIFRETSEEKGISKWNKFLGICGHSSFIHIVSLFMVLFDLFHD